MDNKDILKRITALEKWKEERTRQQIVYPLDDRSFQILNKYFLSSIGSAFYQSGGNDNLFKEVIVQQDGKINSLGAEFFLLQYSVNLTNSTVVLSREIINGGQAYLFDNQQVVVASGTIVNGIIQTPDDGFGPISGIKYVVNASLDGTIVQLSDSMGGPALNFTTRGIGNQYLILI